MSLTPAWLEISPGTLASFKPKVYHNYFKCRHEDVVFAIAPISRTFGERNEIVCVYDRSKYQTDEEAEHELREDSLTINQPLELITFPVKEDVSAAVSRRGVHNTGSALFFYLHPRKHFKIVQDWRVVQQVLEGERMSADKESGEPRSSSGPFRDTINILGDIRLATIQIPIDLACSFYLVSAQSRTWSTSNAKVLRLCTSRAERKPTILVWGSFWVHPSILGRK